MYTMHAKMSTFYNQHVRLPQKQRSELGEHRNTNLERLNTGLAKIGEEDGTVYANPIRHSDQGSYAMHTLNQRSDNDYDIDVAVIFRQGDLPATALDARKRIERAFKAVGGNFKKPPKARTNAVTVWYNDGYHIDFAVYREVTDEYGDTVTEHAGADWKVRNPVEITNWFKQTVRKLSPSKETGSKVDDGQFRRIVRLLKAFAKSRPSWDLPGGFIISKLAEECYRADNHADDEALYWTMSSIRNRLLSNLEVYDPIHPEQKLTYKEQYVKQVERLRDKLGEALTQLAVLFEHDCTQTKAMNAWYWVFQHDFWRDDDGTKSSESPRGPTIMTGSRHDVRESPPFA